MRKLVSLVAAASIAAGTMIVAPAADARPGARKAVKHGQVHRRNRGNAAAGAAVAGIAGALIGGAIAAQRRDRYYDEPYGYGYGGPAYGYGGPAYGYNDGW